MAVSAPTHAQLIQASWARCREYGLTPQNTPDFDQLSGTHLGELLERQQVLLRTTRDEVMPQFSHLLGNSSYLIMLSDEQGRLLDTWGTRRFIDPHQQHGFVAGARWLEQGVGTNAIGTALACAQAVHVGQDEHFLKLNRYMASAAAPLIDAERRLIGVLDVSSDSYLPASQTLGLVRMMSQSLENRLIMARYAGHCRQLSFNSGSNNLDSQWAGLLLEKDIPVLIQGETGVGKEVFVNALHAASSRRHQPLIAVNCASIPAELVESELFGYEKGAFTGAHHKGNPGLIRKADHGIVFLDEIGDMPLSTQARLLRFLQQRSIQPLGSGEPVAVDIRVVSATHQDLPALVRQGRFRQDLYYRIAGMSLTLPPLRERSDRLALIRQIHQQHRAPDAPGQLDSNILQHLLQHPWPGNLRQLSSTLQVALALADGQPIAVEHLPDSFLAETVAPPCVGRNAAEEDLSLRLRTLNGNVSALARDLGISRTTLYKRLRDQGQIVG
ncbi:sigma-54-dependent Fis family transcriptional regulator [Pseudomonas sp. JUb96]|uniref:sigma-54-dependent Fis family transcriptional regulator n=1 Tax=Pseudomonas sp. JUb96 TaxID=2940539 RepID=UPI0022272985|nr:sigma-54-dependent Fis family transcriptional regulator [Pseudomonas sp. JUb96]MCW2267281.1 transcriptional regulator of acetoin/glycerol metabolism [Pseudomonas sp. JUb96]